MCDKVGLVEFKRLQTYFKSNKATKSKSPHTDWQGSMASETAEEDHHTRYRDTEGYEVKSKDSNKGCEDFLIMEKAPTYLGLKSV